jgi:hypothetical protein
VVYLFELINNYFINDCSKITMVFFVADP